MVFFLNVSPPIYWYQTYSWSLKESPRAALVLHTLRQATMASIFLRLEVTKKNHLRSLNQKKRETLMPPPKKIKMMAILEVQLFWWFFVYFCVFFFQGKWFIKKKGWIFFESFGIQPFCCYTIVDIVGFRNPEKEHNRFMGKHWL